MLSIEQHPKNSVEKNEVSDIIYNFQQIPNFGFIETNSKVSRVSTETSVE
jgi:hypothetical protein